MQADCTKKRYGDAKAEQVYGDWYIWRDRCTAYAQMVVDGKSPHRVGELEILACKRHLEDLERQPEVSLLRAKAKEVIDFAEKLIIAEGDEPKPVKLHGFQDFIFGSLYGWRNARGFRRFRLSYIEIARQNGKSFCNGINASYIGNFSFYGQL